jgi:hypothetical protein
MNYGRVATHFVAKNAVATVQITVVAFSKIFLGVF